MECVKCTDLNRRNILKINYMIEILFRGQKVDTKEWVYGDLVMVFDAETLKRSPHIVISYNYDTFDWNEVIPDSVGQFTGLKDKSGVNIFSDDLLKDSKGDIFRIYQIAGGFCIKSSIWKTDINDFNFTDILIAASLSDAQMQSYILESCEIIGNIHDKDVL